MSSGGGGNTAQSGSTGYNPSAGQSSSSGMSGYGGSAFGGTQGPPSSSGYGPSNYGGVGQQLGYGTGQNSWGQGPQGGQNPFQNMSSNPYPGHSMYEGAAIGDQPTPSYYPTSTPANPMMGPGSGMSGGSMAMGQGQPFLNSNSLSYMDQSSPLNSGPMTAEQGSGFFLNPNAWFQSQSPSPGPTLAQNQASLSASQDPTSMAYGQTPQEAMGAQGQGPWGGSGMWGGGQGFGGQGFGGFGGQGFGGGMWSPPAMQSMFGQSMSPYSAMKPQDASASFPTAPTPFNPWTSGSLGGGNPANANQTYNSGSGTGESGGYYTMNGQPIFPQ